MTRRAIGRRSSRCSRPRATPPTSSTTRCSARSRATSSTPRGSARSTSWSTVSRCATASNSPSVWRSTPTLPVAELLLSKLQVVKINRKDVLDALVLLAEHPLAQDDGGRRPHGGADQRPEDPRNHLGRLGLVADRDRQSRQAGPVPRHRPRRTSISAGRRCGSTRRARSRLSAGDRRRPEVDAVAAPCPGRRARPWYADPRRRDTSR